MSQGNSRLLGDGTEKGSANMTRKPEICPIHGEEKVLHSNGSLRCVLCRRKQNNAIYAAHRVVHRGVRWNDPLDDVEGPVRLTERYPTDIILMKALALRIEFQRKRRGDHNWKRSDVRENGRQEEVRA